MSCLIVTPEIRELAEKLQEETEQSVLGLVALWQEQNNRSIEEYPTKEELIDFRDTIRKTEAEKMLDEGLSPTSEDSRITNLEEQAKVDLDFDPQTRRDRVTLIAKLFNNEVDKAVQELNESLNERLNTASESEKQQLQKDIHNLNRVMAIKTYTPGGLFNRVKSIFQDYVNDTEENRVKVELDKINATPGAERYTNEQKLEAAKKRALYKEQAYRKIVDNFKPLAEEASSALVLSEGIKVDLNYVAPKEVNLSEDSIDGEGVVEELADEYGKEESIKDGWMSNVREVSSHESLSQAVRKIINQIPKLDYRGKFEKDDLGFPRYLDANYVHATLIDKLKDMITAEDMIPALQELAKTKPWVKQVIKLLQKDETLFSQFYSDFRKDFVPYWVQKKIPSPDGTFRMQTVAINKPEGIYYLLDSWRDNYESGNQLDEDSVYNKNGSINTGNAEKGLKLVEELNNKFSNLNTEARMALFEDPKVWGDILKALKMIGIDANPSILKNALTDIKTSDTIKYTDPIMILLPQLNIIFNGIKKGDIKSEIDENGVEKRGDLINTFGSAYNTIANMLANVTEDAIESSVSQSLDGKTKSYYSHVVPNYLGKLMKQFKNVSKDPVRFKKFINTEFKQFEWFFKDGRWRSDWVEQLVNSEEMRKGFSHKVVLSSDRVGYTNWDPINYTIALLTEYWGTPDDSRSGTKWAWYHVPILSDSPSAEFIRFRKYVSGVEYDENDNKLTYEDIILDKLTDLVNQEYDRIMLVRERADRYQNGESIDLIDNFDMKDGKVGGAEFKFLPALNSLTFEGGETFLQRMSDIIENGTGAELKGFIRNSLKKIMDNSFEEAYQNWARMGLFEEVNGKYKYLPNNMFKVGQIQQNSKTAKSLIKAKEVVGNLWTSEMEKLLGDYNNNNSIDDRVANRVLSLIREYISQKASRGSITQQEANSINKGLIVKNNAKDALREYFWNSTLATSQIIELTTTDLAFYKNLEDFQKRFKEVHAPSNRLNTHATYKGERIGREIERTIYLKDDEIVSSVLEDIKEVLDAKIEKGEMSKFDRDAIIEQFEKVNVADAQAYRSLSSYRAVLGMMGQWTDDMEQAYNNFKNGNWDINDFNTIWQTKKPYVYTQISNESGVPGHTGIKTPVQHKNSEFLLLAIYNEIAGPLGKSGKLKAINKFMEENNIDVVQFESTTKVGGQGKIDINDVNTEADVIQRLKDKTGIGTGNENPNVVHAISYEDYGIQTPTPEHIIDTKQGIGTQLRKLIMADIAEDAELSVDGKKMSKEEWVKLYNAVNTENILQSFKDINKIFQDPKQLEKVLLDEMRGNPRYSADMVKACTLNEDGQFDIPLFDPVQSAQLQTLLNSIIKSRITKQKTRGGALIQVSSYGLSDQLHIVYEGKGTKKRIKYMECYMPAYSREFYEPLMDPETHQLDISKLPEDLRKLVGYRIPTEDKYSMAPLRIKGFLPQQNGSAIMLPAEITTIAGSDFDVDKLYVMLPEFEVDKYDYNRARQDFKAEQKVLDGVSSLFKEGSLIDDIANAPAEFKEWFNTNKSKYELATPRLRRVRYNFNKTPQENSLKARNNLLLDMWWSVLTNSDTASKILNPGGFNYQKKAARIISILQSSTEASLRKELKISEESIISKLQSMEDKDLEKLAEKTKKKLNPLSPTTQVYFHQQNMTGGKLIAIYANHNANHALMQHTKLGLDIENGSFKLNGKRLTSLHGIMNDNKEFISKNNAGFLAASVDNVKDPVLARLNQNTFTADASMLLSRLGYNPIEIGLLMMQPIVVDITQSYFRENKSGKSKDAIIRDVLANYKKKAAMMENITYDNYKDNDFSIEDLANNILIAKEMPGITSAQQTSDYDKAQFYKKQAAVGFLFTRIMKDADALGQLVQSTRADTPNGAAGPTIADTKIKIQKVQDFIQRQAEEETFPLVGADILNVDIKFTGDEGVLRKQLLDSSLPFLQAFYTLGISQTEDMLSKYFPQFTEPFNEVIDKLRSMTKLGRLDVNTMNSVYNDLLAYIMSSTEFFGAESDWAGLGGNSKIVSSSEKRMDFVNHFPEYFKRVVSENEDIASLEFIKRLKVMKANSENPVETIVFKNVGKLTATLKERYMRDWTSLLYMPNPEAHKLALNLFRYNYYRNGFAFGPSTFIHLAPTTVRKAIPKYVETLRTLLTSKDDYSDFVNQYVYNHLDNRRLVPEVPQDSSVSFIDENGNAKDEVTFIIDKDSNSSDQKVVRQRRESLDDVSYDFFNYIARKDKGNFIYYRLSGEPSGNTAIYKRIEPLGSKNSFIEYEYGKDVEEMVSVIDKNRKNYDPSSEATYEAFVDYEAPQMTEDDYSRSEEYKESFKTEAVDQAFEAYYGVPLDKITEDDITSLQPNTEFVDENGEKICGA